MLLAHCACAPTATPTPTPTPEPVTLRFAFPLPDQDHYQRLIDQFTKQNPHIKIELIGRTDAVKIVVRNGYHGSRIKDFSPEQKDLFYSSLEKWLGLELERR